MESKLSDIMYKEPTIATADENRDTIFAKMKKLDLLQIPILDNEGRVVGLETLQHLLVKARHDNPVFLMAGGFGKRLSPLTDHTPKPLLKVGKKPILETIVDQFISAGFHDFYISTHYKAEMLRKHFGDGSDWDVSIKYVHEDEPLGTAGALGLLPKDLPDLPILMMNGDLLTKIDFEQLLNFHIKQRGDATMCVREYDFQVPYGVIKSKENRIIQIIEKPIHKFFVNAGIYVLSPSLVQTVDGVTYLDMPNMLESKIEQGGQVNMFPVHEYWLDIGQMDQFEQASCDSKNWEML
jgi:NDP-sugar pyrophosphorylase family protein